MVSPLSAAQAYAAVQSAASAVPTSAVEGPGFGDMLQQAMQDTIATSKHAETQMAAHIQGKAELVDVVTAVAAAQQSLETVMAVRDQVIAAYQEIMRMPI